MEGAEEVDKLVTEALGYAEKAQETWVRLRSSTSWMDSPGAAQLPPLAQALCSYAQRFNNSLEVLTSEVGVVEEEVSRQEGSRGRGRKRKGRGEDTERATTPDAAEALTALQGLLETEPEENGDVAGLLAEPRELDSTSEDERHSVDDPLAAIPLTSYTMDFSTGEMVGEEGEGGNRGGSSDSADIADLKKCNCKKSRCLKLYCECFSSGVFCESACMCLDCLNIVQFTSLVTETRQHILGRSPNAFAPKVSSEGGHKKGCHCKKSRCLKKYCECYQANVPCTESCRCENCENNGPSAPRDESPQESLAPAASIQVTTGSQGRSSDGRGKGQGSSQSQQLHSVAASPAPAAAATAVANGEVPVMGFAPAVSYHAKAAPEGIKLRPHPQPSAAAIRSRSLREDFRPTLSALGAETRQTRASMFDPVDFGGPGVQVAAEASGQPCGMLRRSNRQARKLASSQTATVQSSRPVSINSRLHLKTENWPPHGKLSAFDARSQMLLPLTGGRSSGAAVASLGTLPAQVPAAAGVARPRSNALIVADAAIPHLGFESAEILEQVQDQAGSMLKEFQRLVPESAAAVPGVSVQMMSGPWSDSRHLANAHTLVLDTAGGWAKLRPSSSRSVASSGFPVDQPALTESQISAFDAGVPHASSAFTSETDDADDVSSPPESKAQRKLSAAAAAVEHRSSSLLQEPPRGKRLRQAHRAVEAPKRPRVATWGSAPAATDEPRQSSQNNWERSAVSEPLSLLADMAEAAAEIGGGTVKCLIKQQGQLAQGAQQRSTAWPGAPQHPASSRTPDAGWSAALQRPAHPALPDILGEAQPNGHPWEASGCHQDLQNGHGPSDAPKVSPPGSDDQQAKMSGKENSGTLHRLPTDASAALGQRPEEEQEESVDEKSAAQQKKGTK